MIEAGVELPDFEVANEIKAIRLVSRDMTGTETIPLRNGGAVSALDMQREYLARARQWLEVRPDPAGESGSAGSAGANTGTPNEEMGRLLELWGRTLDAVDSGDYSTIDRDIDWAIKLSLLRRYMDRGLDIADPKLAQIDLAYHDVRPGRGIFRILESRGAVSRWITDAEVDDAIANAPRTTRAVLRGRFLKAARAAGATTVVDWTHLKVSGDDPVTVVVDDPFATSNADAEKLIDMLEAMPATHAGDAPGDGAGR